MIGIDTTALIDFFKKNENLKLILDEIDDTFTTTILNYQEIMFGLDLENLNHIKEESFYDKMFGDLLVFDLDKESAKKSSKIYWQTKNEGNVFGKFDCMIAAIFLSNGVNKIITKTAKHFDNIPGLKVLSY